MSKFKIYLVLTVLFSLSIVCTLSELVLYYYFAKAHRDNDNLEISLVPTFNSPFLYARKPNQVGKVAGKTNHVNNAGFRRIEDTVELRSRDKRRVLSYGDSIGHGYKVEDGEQYTDQLERMLNHASTNPQWEVLSTFRGSSPGIYAFHIQVDQPRFQPDWVLLEIELQNDLSDEALLRLGPRDNNGLPNAVYGARYVVSLEGEVINNLSSTIPFISRTLLYSSLASALGRVRSRLTSNPLFSSQAAPYYYNVGADQFLLTQDRLDQAFDEMFKSILAIQKFVEAKNTQFLLILVAGRDAFGTDKRAEVTRKLFQRAVTRSVDLGIHHVNTYPYLEQAGGQMLFSDFCHPNRLGHEAIARALYEIFSQKHSGKEASD